MITAATYQKVHIFDSDELLDMLKDTTLRCLEDANWQVHAWVFLVNHYHLLIHRTESEEALSKTISRVHRESATLANQMIGVQERRVWFQYWDSPITYERAYLARIKYIHENPVRHGIVKSAREYRWSSLAWFEQTAPTSFFNTVDRLKVDQVNVLDDF